MMKSIKRSVMLVMVVVMAVGVMGFGTGTSYAQDPGNGSARDGAKALGKLSQIVLQTSAEALGMTVREMIMSAEDGQSLNDILSANGIDPATVATDAKAQATTLINEAVAENKITDEQAERLLEQLDEAIERIMNHELSRDKRERLALNLARTTVEAAAGSVGMEASEFLRSGERGQSISDILVANGGNPDQVAADVKAEVTQTINEALANGEISEEVAQRLLEGLDEAITRIMNEPLGRQDDRQLFAGLARTLIETAATSVGLEVGEFLRSAEPGQSLSEVIVANGGNPEQVAVDTKAQATETINEALANGEISEEVAQRLLDALDETIARIMDEELGRRHNREERGSSIGELRERGEGQGVLE